MDIIFVKLLQFKGVIMKYLFNGKGKHIANFVNGQLYSPKGKNIGHYIEKYNIFIDMKGHYLGEIIYDNRLMYNRGSSFRYSNFGIYGNYGNIGNYGNPGNCGSLGSLSNYREVDILD